MSTPPRTFPSALGQPGRVDTRDTALDDTIESSFPASDPPSSIPDPEPDRQSSAAGTIETLASSPIFWAALGAVAISAVWLGLAWQRGGRRW